MRLTNLKIYKTIIYIYKHGYVLIIMQVCTRTYIDGPITKCGHLSCDSKQTKIILVIFDLFFARIVDDIIPPASCVEHQSCLALHPEQVPQVMCPVTG